MSTNQSEKLRTVEKKYPGSLGSLTDKVTSQDKKFLDEFLAIVEKNLADPEFDIDVLCEKLLVSRSTLFRKIQSITGEGANEFIQSYRLERAAQLLRDNYGNVTEVAAATGFSDQFYFSKCFKKKFQQSPKEYQLNQLNKPASESIIRERLKTRNEEKSSSSEHHVVSPIAFFDQELVARGTQMMAAQQLLFKDMKGKPQSEEIFKQVMEYYELNSTLNEALKHFEPQELSQKIRLMIDAEKSKPRR